MSKRKALELAIRTLEKRRQALAFDAHACEQYGMDTPYGNRALQEYQACKEAIKVLAEMKRDGMFS